METKEKLTFEPTMIPTLLTAALIQVIAKEGLNPSVMEIVAEKLKGHNIVRITVVLDD